MSHPDPIYNRREWNFEQPKKLSDKNVATKSENIKESKFSKPIVLKPISFMVNLNPIADKSLLTNIKSSTSQVRSFSCKFCGSIFKDTSTYLDHLNGKSHQFQK